MKIRCFITAALVSAAVLLSGCTVNTAKTEKPVNTVTETKISETEVTTVSETEETPIPETEGTTVPGIEKIVITPREGAERKQVALTFDDGPNTTTTAEILDILEQYGIKASFFVVGQCINEESAEVMKRACDMGCEINSHSFTHNCMNEMEPEEIREEMEKTAKLIFDNTGEKPKFFRPPYIAVDSEMYENIDLPFICGEGCNDWDVKIPVEKRVKFLTERTKDGMIILLHDSEGNVNTVEALKEAIPKMLTDGYEFLTVSELFEVKGVVPTPGEEYIYTMVG